MPASSSPRPSANLRGILFMLAATLFLTSMSTMVRSLTDQLHAFEIAFFRNIIGFCMLLPVILRTGIAPLRTDNVWLMAGRGLFNAAAMMLYFLALALVPLAEVSALTFTTPLFVALMAIPILKDIPGPRRILSLVIGFSGALLILRPGIEIINIGAIYALASAASWAVAVIIIKYLSKTNSSVTITLYGLFFLTLFTLPPALFVWRWPTLEEYLVLAALAAAGTIGQLAFAQSMKSADVSLVMPFDFAKLIWASLFGFLFFAEVPTVWTFAGGTIIFASATYVTYRERESAKVPGGNSSAAPTEPV